MRGEERDIHKSRVRRKSSSVQVTGQLWDSAAKPRQTWRLDKPDLSHLSEHTFLFNLAELLEDEQANQRRERIVYFRQRIRDKFFAAVVPQWKAEYGEDIFSGRTVAKELLRKILAGSHVPVVTDTVDEVRQIARDFALTGDWREEFIARGHDYVRQCKLPAPVPERVEAPEEKEPASFTSRVRNAPHAGLQLPEFFEREVFSRRILRGSTIQVVRPGSEIGYREKLNFGRLRHNLNMGRTLIEFISGREESLRGSQSRQRLEGLEKLLKRLLILPDDPLYAQAMAAFAHDVAVLAGMGNGKAGR